MTDTSDDASGLLETSSLNLNDNDALELLETNSLNDGHQRRRLEAARDQQSQ